jgi:3-oxocholest-4-en-26-oate---CoA ligase
MCLLQADLWQYRAPVDHSLWTLLDRVATALPDQDAIVWRDSRLSYRRFRDRSLRLAGVLAGAGLGRHIERARLEPWESGQDLVATYLLNGPEYLEVTFGSYAASAAPFNVNYRYAAAELAYLLDDASPGAVVFHSRFAATLSSVLAGLRRKPEVLLQVADGSGAPLLDGAVFYEEALASAEPVALPEPSCDDLYVLYTGGTTGMPKGTLWRQADIWVGALGGDVLGEADVDAVVDSAVTASKLGRGRFLPNAPMMHGAAQWVAMRTLLSGGTVIINDTVDRLDADEAWRIVEREKVDTMLMVGESMARPLVEALEARDSDASSMFAILTGGATTLPATKARLIAKLPDAMVVDSAGSSESGTGLTAVSTRGSNVRAGVFQATNAIAVLDESRSRLLSPGDEEIGWYAKKGRIPLGYLGDEARTRATFPVVEGERWSVPGDRARWLADGTVELLGRDSVTINTGGEKVFAEEVEGAILTHPAVKDAVVVGRSSERWGQEVVAVVSLYADSVSDDDLREAAAEVLARYKLPKAIVRVAAVLRSPAGKADYRWAKSVAEAASENPSG